MRGGGIRKDMLLPMLLAVFSMPADGPVQAEKTEKEYIGTQETVVLDTLSESVLVTPFKQMQSLERLASPVSVVFLKDMEDRGLKNPKDLSSIIPNLLIPDYGSAMTSTIYLRGFGSRIDNPVIGLYIDDVPVMNKNSYDLELFDVRRADFMRGPQGTIYGRNSMCGVLSLTTLSPMAYQGIRAGVEYGSANTVSARASYYHMTERGAGLGAALNYRRSDGFYTNEYTGEKCDPYDALSLRFRAGRDFASGFSIENVLWASALDQGGYAYRLYDGTSGTLAPVAYNDRSAYRRLNISEAVKMKYVSGSFTLSSVTSWQFLRDRMDLDQDFTPASMFTLTQSQTEHAVTQEIILKPLASWRTSWWNWQTGVYGFYRHNSMSAPVTMKQDGIDNLILGNDAIPSFVRQMLSFQESEFPIESDFKLQTYGAAIYHESYFTAGKWTFTAGLRLDYEGNSMLYDSRATVHYRFVPVIPDYREVNTVFDGRTTNSYLEFIPKLSALYDFGDFGGNGGLRLFATFSKGYKAGGFNTQIFSDILQNMMIGDLMSDAMGSMSSGGGGRPGMSSAAGPERDSSSGMQGQDSGSADADDTSYLPEHSYNYELGGNFNLTLPGERHTLAGSVSVFYIDCRNQQITVFPDGSSTGRMMANAGRSRSFGAEAQVSYKLRSFSASASYGYTDARFIRYNDGQSDCSGNHIPYSPSNTMNIRAGYAFTFPSDIVRSLTLSADLSGIGRIWWDEANTLSQPFYLQIGADIQLSFKWFDLFFRWDNLTGSDFNVFYFKSVGNAFFQTGKPARFMAGISVEI